VGASFKIFSLFVLGVVSLLMAAYSLVGVLQARMLFTGERAIRNFQVWGTATALFLVCAAACFMWAWRLVRRQRAAVARHLAARRSYPSPAPGVKPESDE
jgi:predicted Co/Zn/Cd cation transporter (cation efflux family)